MIHLEVHGYAFVQVWKISTDIVHWRECRRTPKFQRCCCQRFARVVLQDVKDWQRECRHCRTGSRIADRKLFWGLPFSSFQISHISSPLSCHLAACATDPPSCQCSWPATSVHIASALLRNDLQKAVGRGWGRWGMSRCKQKYSFIDVYRMYGCSPVMPRSCWDEKWTKDDMSMDLLRGCAVLLPNSTASGKARFSNFHEVLPLCPVLRKFVR